MSVSQCQVGLSCSDHQPAGGGKGKEGKVGEGKGGGEKCQIKGERGEEGMSQNTGEMHCCHSVRQL